MASLPVITACLYVKLVILYDFFLIHIVLVFFYFAIVNYNHKFYTIFLIHIVLVFFFTSPA